MEGRFRKCIAEDQNVWYVEGEEILLGHSGREIWLCRGKMLVFFFIFVGRRDWVREQQKY